MRELLSDWFLNPGVNEDVQWREKNEIIFFFLLASYLVGAIPCGYIFGRLKGVDLRHHGSGNIGTTNAFRVLGRKIGVLVFLCDFAKGLFPVVVGKFLGGPAWGVAGGIASVVGHSWSVFLSFQGGRGVATAAGVAIALMPQVVFIAVGIWVIVVFLTRYVSLGSILSALSVPIIALFLRVPSVYYLFAIPVPAIIIYRHLPNIKRLIKGTEPRIQLW